MLLGFPEALARSTGLQRLRGSVGETDEAEAGEASSAPANSWGDSRRALNDSSSSDSSKWKRCQQLGGPPRKTRSDSLVVPPLSPLPSASVVQSANEPGTNRTGDILCPPAAKALGAAVELCEAETLHSLTQDLRSARNCL